MSKIEQKIQRARTGLLMQERFFGNLLTYLPMEQSADVPTMATNGEKILYNKKFVESLTRDETIGVLAHETGHVLFNHHTERNGRDRKDWNRACDYMINLLLAKSGFTLPVGGLLERGYEGKTAKQIYNIIHKPGKDQGKAKPGPGQGNQDQGKAKPGPGQGNQDQGKKIPDLADCGPGAVMDGPGTDSDRARNAQTWKIRACQALSQAEMSGGMSAGLKQEIKAFLKPAVNWKSLLWQFAQTVSRDDYTFTRPSRRAFGDIILPSLYSDKVDDLIIAYDVSGSTLSLNHLEQFAAEVTEILNTLKPTVKILYFDSKITDVQEFFPDDVVKLRPSGGGCTDYKPIFKHVDNNFDAPTCLIVLTDGWCRSFPKKAPDYPVLWVTDRKKWRVPFGDIAEF